MSGVPQSDPGALSLEIEAVAAGFGITLPAGASRSLALHALAVQAANARLHLTAITDPREFLERHVGEAFQGAALLKPDITGVLADIGSGNGYPALPIAAARPGLRPVLAEASTKKATFLESALEECGLGRGEVVRRQVQRGSDLETLSPVRLFTLRAVGGWFRLIPKLVPALEDEGQVLLWAGDEVETIRQRVAWRRLRLEAKHPLSGATQSAIWVFRRSLTLVRS